MNNSFGLALSHGVADKAVRSPQRVGAVTATASGFTTLVAAPGAGFRILLVGFLISTSAAVNVYFASASTALSAPLYLAANSTGAVPDLQRVYLTCADNEALRINLSGTANVGVTVAYRVVPTA